MGSLNDHKLYDEMIEEVRRKQKESIERMSKEQIAKNRKALNAEYAGPSATAEDLER